MREVRHIISVTYIITNGRAKRWKWSQGFSVDWRNERRRLPRLILWIFHYGKCTKIGRRERKRERKREEREKRGQSSNWVIIVSRIESGLIFPSPLHCSAFSHGGVAHYAIKYERQRRAARNYFSRRTAFFLPAAKPLRSVGECSIRTIYIWEQRFM